MTFPIERIDMICGNQIYMIESLTIHDGKKYADAYRRYQGRYIKVECEETRELLAAQIGG